MSFLKGAGLFILGAAAGFGSCFLFLKNKYERMAQDDIDEVKKYYLEKNLKRDEEVRKIEEESKKMNEAFENYKEIVRKVDLEKGEESMAAEENPEEEEPTAPYMITEDEFFNDKNDYEKLSLTYFTVDDTLADDCDEMVDVEETISSDIYNQISESDDGDYYVRNPVLQVDYEIMKVDQSYKERYGFDY